MILNIFYSNTYLTFFDHISLRYAHSMLVHFPIAYSYLILVVAMRNFLIKGNKKAETDTMWKVLFLSCLFFTIIAGRVTAHKMGLQLNDSTWIEQNREISSIVLSHRSLGDFIAIFWTFLFGCHSYLIKKNISSKKTQLFFLVGSLIGVVLISLNGLIGSHIGR